MTAETPPDSTSIPRPKRGAAAASTTDASGSQAPTRPAVVEDGSVIQADRVEVRMAAVGRADTHDLDVERGAVGAARADAITVHQGAIGASLTSQATVRQSFVRSVLAREAVVQQSFVRTLVAAEVRIERASGVGILIARRVTGDVRVLLDWRGAAAFGAAFGLVVGLLRRRGHEEPPGD